MNQSIFQHTKQFIQTEQKLRKKHYWLIVALIILGWAYYGFIEPETIGHDIRYSIYIFWLPTIVGVLILGFYRRRFLINRFAVNKGIVLQAFMAFFYLAQGFLFSYLSFGQMAKMSWDYFNYKAVMQNTEETFVCPITRFSTSSGKGTRPGIDFKWKGRHERLNAARSQIKPYENQRATDYQLKINATKGIWNYYTVNDWTIVKVN